MAMLKKKLGKQKKKKQIRTVKSFVKAEKRNSGLYRFSKDKVASMPKQ